MNRFADRILNLGSLVGKLCASVVGGFVFLRGFRLIASENEESAVGASFLVDSTPAKPWAGLGAALLLLTFVTNEAVVVIRALCR